MEKSEYGTEGTEFWEYRTTLLLQVLEYEVILSHE